MKYLTYFFLFFGIFALLNSCETPNSDDEQEVEIIETIFHEVSHVSPRRIYLYTEFRLNEDRTNSVYPNFKVYVSTDNNPNVKNSEGYSALDMEGYFGPSEDKSYMILSIPIVGLKPDKQYNYLLTITYLDNSKRIKGSFRTSEENFERGGYTIHEKDSPSDGWQYIMAAPPEWIDQVSVNNLNDFIWGCLSTNVDSTSADLGAGFENTKRILDEKCQENPDSKVAYKTIDSLQLNGFDDWYLPSISEAGLILRNQFNIGLNCNYLWTSNEYEFDISSAYTINYGTEGFTSSDDSFKDSGGCVIPVRRQ